MKIVLVNNSSDTFSYVSGLIVVPANSSSNVAPGLWTRMYADAQFLTDLRNNNLIINDGATNFRYPESESWVKYSIMNFEATPVRKDFSYSTAQTNTIIWTPASGKKFVVTDIVMNVRNSTLGALTLAIFDDTNAAGNSLHKATYESGANTDVISNLGTPFVSNALNQSLKITTSGGLTISGTVWGYETE